MTLEYGHYKSEYPGLEWVRPHQFRQLYQVSHRGLSPHLDYQEGKLPLFDFIFSYSSVEHSGLGTVENMLRNLCLKEFLLVLRGLDEF